MKKKWSGSHLSAISGKARNWIVCICPRASRHVGFKEFGQIQKNMFKNIVFIFLFILNGVDGDEVKSVSVMEGDSVALHTDITEIQTDDQILWQFGPQETLIAQIIKQANLSLIFANVDDGRFRGKLQLNSQTGSLTITNIRSTHTGLYKVMIMKNSGSSYKRFNVTVYAPLPVPVITRISNSSYCSSSSERSSSSKCVLLCSVLNVRDVSLSWYKENSLLSSISVSDLNIRLSLPLEVEYQDNNKYKCVVNNPITNQTQHSNNALCQLCSEQKQRIHLIALIVIPLLLLLISGACAMYWKWKKCKPVETIEEEIHYATTTFCARRVHSTEPAGPVETIYSGVLIS